MSIVSEVFFYLCSQDLFTILTYSVMVLSVIGMAVIGKHEGHSDGCSCSGCAGGEVEQRDIEPLKKRAAELESMSVRSIEQSEELSDIYTELATIAYDEGEDLETVVMLFGHAEKTLKNTLEQGDDTEIRRKLGNVYLHRAVTYNDFDELDSAVDSYNTAIATLKPLDDAGDGEAKYDIAGIQFNRGMIYHECGDFLKAKTDYDESFLAFRAVEKISDFDTRYFMAKVSVAQGTLFRDMDESLDKVVDAYNRAMRLFVELIDMGQMEHERELANVLMDRCTATYDFCRDHEFESELEKTSKIGDVLVDVGRGIEILDRIVKAEPQFENRIDLFNAIATEGAILLDIEKFDEAIKSFDRTIDEFSDFMQIDDPVILQYFATIFSNRANCLTRLDKLDDALKDMDECAMIADKIQNTDYGLSDDEKAEFQVQFTMFYANRANIFKVMGNKEEANKNFENGYRILGSLKESFDEDLGDIIEVYDDLKKEIDELPD
ncbi:MAG: hypothetical protein LBH59_04165 [Planctomycetaceae bacterium]|jgi:tetratricopeptide (TPR) repeat protein|nr:hypothetical protein [Planctomycetaceae bacterium]